MAKALSIINPVRPQAIGDAVSAFPAVAAWDGDAVFFSCEAARSLFFHQVKKLLDAQPKDSIVLTPQNFVQAEAEGLHFVQAWFRALRLPLPQPPFQWPVNLGCPISSATCDVWISPFSASDFGTGHKVWPQNKWDALINRLHKVGLQVGLVCGHETDKYDVDTSLNGAPLEIVCRFFMAARCVVTIDNGVSLLAQVVRANHVLLQAANHRPHWTADHTPGAINIHSVLTAEVDQVFDAVMGQIGE